MAKRRQEVGESSARQQGKRRKLVLDDSASEQSGNLSFGCLEKELLRGEVAIARYAEDFSIRNVELERAVDTVWLHRQGTLELGSWLDMAGWTDLVSVKEPVFQRLVRILYANLDPNTMISWIGTNEVNLNEATWCNAFNLPAVSIEEEASLKSMSRNTIFYDLVGQDNVKHGTWINANDLPKVASVRLAMSIIIHTILPKKRNKDQIKEREGRILYALMSGMKFNIGREIVSHIRQAFYKKTLPLCLPMHLMRIMKLAKVDLKLAGTADVKRSTPTSMINGNTLGRIGFKRDNINWVYVGRGNVKGKSRQGSHSAAAHGKGEDEEEEEEEEQQEDHLGHEESTPASAMPGPSTSTRPNPTTPPHITHQLSNLQATIDHLSANLTEKLAYLSATVNSKLESMDSKLDNLQHRVQSCEEKLDLLTSESPFPSPTFTPNYSPSYSPPSPPYSPAGTPIDISSDSQPTPLSIIPPHRPTQVYTKRSSSQKTNPSSSSAPAQPIPIPIPSSSPPSSPPKEPGSSPLFSMDELLQSAPILQPEPPTTTQPSQPDPPPSATTQALQVVCSTLQIDKPKRYKMTATKHASKPSKHQSKEPPK